ncbi:Uncharacterized protein FWK35_00035570 [Aphis craccivora]|uniref:THAP-type domain-containing protein n=1 Tax=Aphis craccivora TaxID=307492 RepID=A0A6G0VN36_APHCR|nr:Uncharacterized protein FWK35_00035570 [Aphis craccivora]
MPWESAINNTINNQFKSLNYICSEHFLPDDIITDYSIPFDVAENHCSDCQKAVIGKAMQLNEL